MRCPDYPHITQKFEVNALENNHLGSTHSCNILYKYRNSEFEAYRVFPHEYFPESAHITFGVKERSFFQTKTALEDGEGKVSLKEER